MDVYLQKGCLFSWCIHHDYWSSSLGTTHSQQECFNSPDTFESMPDLFLESLPTHWLSLLRRQRHNSLVIHLFDIDVPGKIRFQESETLSPGYELARFKTEWHSIGLSICNDLRFSELARLYALQDVSFLVHST